MYKDVEELDDFGYYDENEDLEEIEEIFSPAVVVGAWFFLVSS